MGGYVAPGRRQRGGLFGYLVSTPADDATIRRSSYVTAANGRAGGLVGYVDNWGSIQETFISATFSGKTWAGGLVGVHGYGPVSSSYATVDVTGSGGGRVGGVEQQCSHPGFLWHRHGYWALAGRRLGRQ